MSVYTINDIEVQLSTSVIGKRLCSTFPVNTKREIKVAVLDISSTYTNTKYKPKQDLKKAIPCEGNNSTKPSAPPAPLILILVIKCIHLFTNICIVPRLLRSDQGGRETLDFGGQCRPGSPFPVSTLRYSP